MKDCFRYAKVSRVTLVYFLDSNPDVRYTVYFGSLDAAHSWLAQSCNHNKSVHKLSMLYVYPE